MKCETVQVHRCRDPEEEKDGVHEGNQVLMESFTDSCDTNSSSKLSQICTNGLNVVLEDPGHGPDGAELFHLAELFPAGCWRVNLTVGSVAAVTRPAEPPK